MLAPPCNKTPPFLCYKTVYFLTTVKVILEWLYLSLSLSTILIHYITKMEKIKSAAHFDLSSTQ